MNDYPLRGVAELLKAHKWKKKGKKEVKCVGEKEGFVCGLSCAADEKVGRE